MAIPLADAYRPPECPYGAAVRQRREV